MLEIIKTIGSFAGLVSAAFLVWDRWLRGRPLVEPKIKFFGVNPYKYIRIQNPGPGPGDVFVLGVSASPPGIYGVAKNHTDDAILQATVPGLYGVADLQLLLQPGGKFDLPINGSAPARRQTVAACPLRHLLAQNHFNEALADPSFVHHHNRRLRTHGGSGRPRAVGEGSIKSRAHPICELKHLDISS